MCNFGDGTKPSSADLQSGPKITHAYLGRTYKRYVFIRSWRRKAPTASNTELDVKVLSDCDVLLRSSHTKDSGIKREMSLSMRAPSVVPRYAVVVGSLKHCAEGERR